MNKKLKFSLIFLFVFIVLAFTLYNYAMHSGKRNLESEKANFSITSSQINTEFNKNPEIASKKYLEKAIEIKGIVSEINNNQLILDHSIVCQCALKLNVKKGEIVTVKGRFVGFDDLMSELKLDQCYLIQ